jgi:hypothetical protein
MARTEKSGKSRKSGKSGKSAKHRHAAKAPSQLSDQNIVSGTSGAAAAPSAASSSTADPPAIASLPNLRLRGRADGYDGTPATLKKKSKVCSFLCGAVCGESPDPLSETRSSIRWGLDGPDETVESLGLGTADYWCERTWALSVAQTTDHRNKIMYQAEIGKDKDKHNFFLAERAQLIARHAEKASKPSKRRGGVKKVSVREQTFSEFVLVRPVDFRSLRSLM